MAEELGWEAHWDGEKFQVREGELHPARGCTPAGARALLVTGEAGTGKTALAEAIADALEARDRYYYVQLHSWTDGKRFFDYQTGPAQSEGKGFLTKVAEASQTEG
ncbi:ATP-binding protein [Acidithiobacillus ferrivorans]|nr:ATP-binding protein [Acidithiobacillus ferrivorans]